MDGMKIVSACLLGVNCNYKGKSKPDPRLLEEFGKGQLYPVCPEVMGGLDIPRPAAEIRGGAGLDVIDGRARVVNAEGDDVTNNFLGGASAVLELTRAVGADEAILKARSPSCGCGRIYDGTFSDTLIDGDGVTAALLRKNGIKVRTEED